MAVLLFPGSVKVEDGVRVAVPVPLFKLDQKVVPRVVARLALSRVKVLLP